MRQSAKKKQHKENLHKNILRPEIETFPIKHKSQEIYVNTGNSKKLADFKENF